MSKKMDLSGFSEVTVRYAGSTKPSGEAVMTVVNSTCDRVTFSVKLLKSALDCTEGDRMKILMCLSEVKSLSCVQLFATPRTVACQAPLSMEFSRQEYWNGLPFPSPGDLSDPGLNPGLLHCKQILYVLSH